MKDFLPHPLYQLHQRFLTSKKLNIFWEMNLIPLLFYGLIFNAILLVVYTYLTVYESQLHLTNQSKGTVYLFFRIPSLIGFLFWARSTYLHNGEASFSKHSSFRLRGRFLIYFLGVLLAWMPLQIMVGIEPGSKGYGLLLVDFEIAAFLFSCFVIALLLNLAKVTSLKNLAIAISLSVPISVGAFVIALLCGFLGQSDGVTGVFAIVFSYMPLALAMFYGMASSKLGYILQNIAFPFLFVQLALMITFIYFFEADFNASLAQETALYAMPIIGYCMYVYLVPKLTGSIRKEEARPMKV